MKKSTLLIVALLLVTLSACGGKEKKESNKVELSKTSTEVKTTNTKTLETANPVETISSSAISETTTESTSTSENSARDPQVIYNALMGDWLSIENDANGIPWSANFTSGYATMAPTQGVGSVLSIKMTSLNWDEQNQSLIIVNEAYDPDGNRVPNSDYTLTVHDIDLENFSQMSISGTTFATSNLTYHRA